MIFGPPRIKSDLIKLSTRQTIQLVSIPSPSSYLSDNTFTFLNIKHQFNDKIDWNYSNYGKLWTYNLNYFDFLHQPDINKEVGLVLIKDFLHNVSHIKTGADRKSVV